MNRFLLSFYVLAALLGAACVAQVSPEHELAGVWRAERRFGPELSGELTISKRGEIWRAQIGGATAEVQTAGADLSFEMLSAGTFLGRLVKDTEIRGHWTQPRSETNGASYSTPVLLALDSEGVWRGNVRPFEDSFRMYLVLAPREDGSLGAFIRNPERNLGVFLNADRLTLVDDRVELIGRWFRNETEQVLAQGTYDPDYGRLSLFLPRGRGTYDFTRLSEGAQPGFLARGENPEPPRYLPPLPRSDGWSVGTLEEVGIAFAPIRDLIKKEIDPQSTSLHDPYVHSLLIARGGKLVFEEYFHGFDAETPHDSRSASKSITAALVGAAIEAGHPIQVSTPVYDSVYPQVIGSAVPSDLDPRKRRMTLEHLLTMSSGYECDDRDYESPGNEDVMWDQQDEEPDFYKYTLGLDMVRDPGETAIYCSINPNLIGAVLEAGTGATGLELLDSLLARPLGIDLYHQNLTPTGDAYMGGGIQWRARDFLKLGQLFVDGGVWKGRRVIGESFVDDAVSRLVEIDGHGYGYLWWIDDLAYEGGTVRAFFAGGNGGQLVMGIPELDLVIGIFAGNYSDRTSRYVQETLVPTYILPAVSREISPTRAAKSSG